MGMFKILEIICLFVCSALWWKIMNKITCLKYLINNNCYCSSTCEYFMKTLLLGNKVQFGLYREGFEENFGYTFSKKKKLSFIFFFFYLYTVSNISCSLIPIHLFGIQFSNVFLVLSFLLGLTRFASSSSFFWILFVLIFLLQ